MSINQKYQFICLPMLVVFCLYSFFSSGLMVSVDQGGLKTIEICTAQGIIEIQTNEELPMQPAKHSAQDACCDLAFSTIFYNTEEPDSLPFSYGMQNNSPVKDQVSSHTLPEKTWYAIDPPLSA